MRAPECGAHFSSGGAQYEFVSVSVRSLAPWSGPEQGGTVVTVGGSGLSSSGVEAVECRFGGGGGGAVFAVKYTNHTKVFVV